MKKIPAGTRDRHIHFYRPQDRYPVAPTLPFPPPNAPVRKYRDVMKDGAWFINASRGNPVDATALERALTNRRVAGAAVDLGSARTQKPSPGLARQPKAINPGRAFRFAEFIQRRSEGAGS